MRPGADPAPRMPQAPEKEKIVTPGAGETELVPPGTDVQAQPGPDGKPRPVIVKPDIQETIGPGTHPDKTDEGN